MRAVNYNNAVIQYTKIDFATAAQHPIAAAKAGNKVVLLGLFLSAAGAVTIQFESANTDLTGAMSLATGVMAPIWAAEYGILSTAVGEALNVTLGGGVQVSGVAAWIYSNPTVDL